MSTDTHTWQLDEAAVPDAIAKLDAINRRAAKQGLAGRYTYSLGETTRTPRWHDELDRITGHQEPDYFEVTVEFIVEGQPVKLNGWTFLATLTWEGGVLVTRTAPGFDGRIDETAVQVNYCDHCKTERRRNDTYLVQHEDGTRKQVGSNCIKDFLGHAFVPSWLTDSAGDMEAEFGSVRDTLDADTITVLAWAASMTAEHGWISRDKAEVEYREPSSSILRDLLFGTSPAIRRAREELRPAAEHYELAAQVRAWAQQVDDTSSEYLANLKRLAASEFIGPRNVGIIGSAVASYHREIAAQVAREAQAVSEYVGQAKDKLVLTVTVKGDTPIDSNYGVTHLYTLVSAEGNVFKWFSTRNQEWAVGQEVTIKGTVKGHETYRDVKQTVLTRCAAA